MFCVAYSENIYPKGTLMNLFIKTLESAIDYFVSNENIDEVHKTIHQTIDPERFPRSVPSSASRSSCLVCSSPTSPSRS